MTQREKTMKTKGTLFVISGPSGVGKGTICKEIIKRHPELSVSVSATTRPMRAEDKDGVTYHFKTKNEFLKMIDENGFLEWTVYNDNYYGTPIAPVQNALESGRDFILEIEVDGAQNVRKAFPDAVLIFIDAPSFDELKARLMGRGSETEESINSRIERAGEEVLLKDKYDFVVVNDDLEKAISDIENIIVKGE